MTDTTDTATVSPNSNHQKKITLTLIANKRWEVDFVGTITRRDIQKLNRVLSVEFAKVQRRRSTKKILEQERISIANREAAASKVIATTVASKAPTTSATHTEPLKTSTQKKDLTNAT